jgi:hypothetical protein
MYQLCQAVSLNWDTRIRIPARRSLLSVEGKQRKYLNFDNHNMLYVRLEQG